jgi:hypothetical protein
MSENPVREWEELQCPKCQGSEFLQRLRLKVRQGAGMSTEVSSWQCAGCGLTADMRQMQAQLTLRHRKAELAALEAEIAQSLPAAPSPTALSAR